jgi:hypothetical protein
MGILSWIVFGLIAGALAKLFMLGPSSHIWAILAKLDTLSANQEESPRSSIG